MRTMVSTACRAARLWGETHAVYFSLDRYSDLSITPIMRTEKKLDVSPKTNQLLPS